MKKPENLDPLRAFHVCLEMEHAGSEFYNRAALASTAPETRDVFLKMTESAVKHEKAFREIITAKSGDKKFMKPYQSDEAVSYISHLAKRDPFGGKASAGQFSLEEAVYAGLEAAKTSILLYTELKNLADKPTAAVFERILRDEKTQYVMLSEVLGEKT